jgi:flagellar biosynthesis component FlhA
VLAMEPSRCQAASAAVKAATHGTGSVLVVDPSLRAFVRRLVELESPDVPVLSLSETSDDTEYSSERVELDMPPPKAKTGGTRHAEGSTAERLDPAPGDEPARASAPGIEVVVPGDFLVRRSPADESSLEEALALMQDGLFYELGILVPQVDVRTDDALDAAEFRIRIGALEPVSSTGLEANEFLVNDTVEMLRLLGLEGREAPNPASGSACTILTGDGRQVQTCQKAGLTVWGPAGYLILRLSRQIRKAAPALQHDKATRHLLDALARSFPALHGRCIRVLHFEPVRRAARAIHRVLALRHDAFEPHLAGVGEDGRAIALDVLV